MRLTRTILPVLMVAVATLTAGCAGTSHDSSSAGATSAVVTPTPTAGSTGPSSRRGTSPSGAASPTHAHPTEFNPPGDIPDNAVFLDHTAPGTRVHFSAPEGWAAVTKGPVTTYTDKYNSISIEVRPQRRAPTQSSARATEVPALRRTVSNFQLQHIDVVQRAHGKAVHLTYLADSAPNPVTDKVVRDAVERFEFWTGDHEVILTLTGPEGADNVDPWQIVSDSVQWR